MQDLKEHNWNMSFMRWRRYVDMVMPIELKQVLCFLAVANASFEAFNLSVKIIVVTTSGLKSEVAVGEYTGRTSKAKTDKPVIFAIGDESFQKPKVGVMCCQDATSTRQPQSETMAKHRK
ncbi:hypothetical protein Tco_1161324 [Tanacetum coccineum]